MIQRRGNVLFTVQLSNFTVWRRHVNQIRPRYSTDKKSIESKLPTELLFEEFSLPIPNPPFSSSGSIVNNTNTVTTSTHTQSQKAP